MTVGVVVVILWFLVVAAYLIWQFVSGILDAQPEPEADWQDHAATGVVKHAKPSALADGNAQSLRRAS